MGLSRFLADLRALDLRSVLKQTFFIPRPTWSIDDIPDLTGKVVIVTGANTGIGKATAKALLVRNAKVYIASRTKERADDAIQELEKITGKKALFLPLDLASLKSVKEAATLFMSQEKELHVLINNAGVMHPPHSQLAEGYDLQFHTNVTGHWYLTKLLLPTMLETVKRSPPGSVVRVVNVSSGGHYLAKAQPLDFATFKGGPARDKYSSQEFYNQSKFGNVIVANEFHRRYADQGLVSLSLNPGNIDTELYRYFKFPLSSLVFYSPDVGALTQLYAATSEEAKNYGGKFLIPWARVGKARPDTDDVQLGKELWAWLEEQVKD